MAVVTRRWRGGLCEQHWFVSRASVCLREGFSSRNTGHRRGVISAAKGWGGEWDGLQDLRAGGHQRPLKHWAHRQLYLLLLGSSRVRPVSGTRSDNTREKTLAYKKDGKTPQLLKSITWSCGKMRLQSDIRTFVSLEVTDTSHPNPFLSEWNPPFSIYIYFFSQEKERPKGSPPKQSVGVGILNLDCYERKHNFSLKQNSESFVN